MAENKIKPRRAFLTFGLVLTLFGCLLAAIAIALPAWQVVELSEFTSIHEHGVFYDCVRSDTIALKNIYRRRANTKADEDKEKNEVSDGTINDSRSITSITKTSNTKRVITQSRTCRSKLENSAESATWTMRMAIEEGDPAAREQLLHRFLPQHKAVIFFFVFSLVFALISIVVGACSECFAPNSVLHAISLALSMCCSILGDIIFFLAANRENGHNIYGLNNNVYQQHVSWAFFLHLFGSLTLCGATLCSLIATYLLVKHEFCLKRQKFPKRSIPYICTAFVNAEKMAMPQTFTGSPSMCNRLVSREQSLDASVAPISATPSRLSSFHNRISGDFIRNCAHCGQQFARSLWQPQLDFCQCEFSCMENYTGSSYVGSVDPASVFDVKKFVSINDDHLSLPPPPTLNSSQKKQPQYLRVNVSGNNNNESSSATIINTHLPVKSENRRSSQMSINYL